MCDFKTLCTTCYVFCGVSDGKNSMSCLANLGFFKDGCIWHNRAYHGKFIVFTMAFSLYDTFFVELSMTFFFYIHGILFVRGMAFLLQISWRFNMLFLPW